MKAGSCVWYVSDLRCEPVRVYITRVYTDIHGDIRWVWGFTKDGTEIDDYATRFTTKKPVTYGGM